MSWTVMSSQREHSGPLWGGRREPEARRPSAGFWAVVSVALPVVNVLAAWLAATQWASLGVVGFFAVLGVVFAGELAALRRWLVRDDVRPAGWLTVAGFLIATETAGVLFVCFVAILAMAGGD